MLARWLSRLSGSGHSVPLEKGPKWVADAASALADLQPPEQESWLRLLDHAATATSSRPSKVWIERARAELDTLDRGRSVQLIVRLFRSILAENFKDRPLAANRNSTLVKGLVWIASLLDGDDLVTSMQQLGEVSFRKVPEYGPGSAKVGNAVIYSLGALPGLTAISRLTALKSRVKYRQAQSLIEKALLAAAEERGLTIDRLEELAVPTHGLDDSGRLERRIGDHVALAEVGRGGRVSIVWRRGDGRIQKTVPKGIKDAHPDEVAALKSDARNITDTWRAQRDRVEHMLLRPRSWSPADWRKQYLDHPLMQNLARRLIWRVRIGTSEALVSWAGGGSVDVTGRPATVPENAEISLWHPIGDDADTVLTWRRFIEARGVTQPFKQAHREIYLVTDAERATDVYSNRFAGHILRQHQFAALCRERGWEYGLQGAFDARGPAIKSFPDLDLVAEYRCDAMTDDAAMTSAGILRYISTDQVRFSRSTLEPMRLADVSPIVFSEVMRDVDLFVGTCSIGNDPGWSDQGPRGNYNRYWCEYASGELSETARTRRDVLAAILPKLRIADRLSLDGRYLRVRGDLRTYRIHLGSANILMEPNNLYLCIVPGSEGRSRHEIMLPFEGDSVLSLILSKAALLAADTKIKDPLISIQIRAPAVPL